MTALPWINHILNDASECLLALEETGRFPSELRVHTTVFRSFEHLRRRELDNGFPLIVLGTSLVEDATLAQDEFDVIP